MTSEDEKYRVKIKSLREQFEDVSSELSQATSALETARTQKHEAERGVRDAVEKKKVLDEEIDSRHKTISSLLDKHKVEIESSSKAEQVILERIKTLVFKADGLSKEIEQLKSTKAKLEVSASELEKAISDRDTARLESSSIIRDLNERLGLVEDEEKRLEKEKQEFTSHKQLTDSRSTENERKAGEIQARAKLLQAHYDKTGLTNKDGSRVDVYKELGIIKDKI